MRPNIEECSIEKLNDLLCDGSLAERCAAALCIGSASFVPDHLIDLLHLLTVDSEPALQNAINITLGSLTIDRQSREGLLKDLQDEDPAIRQAALSYLSALPDIIPSDRLPYCENRESIVDTGFTNPSTNSRPLVESSHAKHADSIAPDVSLVGRLPAWFLIVAISMSILLTWLLRGESITPWILASLGAIGIGGFGFAYRSRFSDGYSIKLFAARIRVIVAILIASLGGLVVTLAFSASYVYVDNATENAVTIFLDGSEWMKIDAKDSKRRLMPTGKHSITIQSLNNAVLDQHDVEILRGRLHALNILGQQKYYHGTARYGFGKGSMEEINKKFMLIPDVHYLFQDPPAQLKGVQFAADRSFITKAKPPAFLLE